ncbi:hypothetical protein AVEN_150631-1 [Araneus ventricosus]|uniref:MBD domain-containing protein n=1 Tax=Araneus ventricosus TaxID=182803 RepID=A0A4Y2PRB8_ARAVE|nr:hypothetical protein AVEN_150631-1 [Araneus ventricosus]
MPTHQQRKPPTFKKGDHSNHAALHASAYYTQSMDIEFVIDSVANEHFVNDTNLFTNFQKLSSSESIAEGTTNILGIDFEFSSNETPIPKPSDKTECDWKRVCVNRQKGKTKGRIDVYYYSEAKVRLRSKNEFKKCCENVEDISDSEAHLVDIKIPNNFKDSQNVPERENWCSATKEEIEILKPEMFMRLSLDPKIRKCWGISGYFNENHSTTGVTLPQFKFAVQNKIEAGHSPVLLSTQCAKHPVKVRIR